jgi:hypothetical protein
VLHAASTTADLGIGSELSSYLDRTMWTNMMMMISTS